MSVPTCAQCGRSGWDIRVNGERSAPLTLERIGSLSADTFHFCNEHCLLLWTVAQREQVIKFWQKSWEKSAGDVNHVLRAPLFERVMIHRWWRKRVEANRA